MRVLLVLALAASALAGCMATAEPVAPSTGGHAVVALIDSGLDPYHQVFHRGPTHDISWIGQQVSGGLESVRFSSTGSHAERRAADAAVWEGLERGVLYHIEGTNVLTISFGGPEPVWDATGHGTAAAGALLAADPGATMVMVQGMNTAAEQWVAEQPWIDIVSMSYGAGKGPTAASMPENTRGMWQAGQIPIASAGNQDGYAPDDGAAGPPWVVGVGADDPHRRCTVPGTSTTTDVSSAYTQRLPTAGTLHRTSMREGNSFAAPVVAGVLSATLRSVRAVWDEPMPEGSQALAASERGDLLWPVQLREAIESVAEPFERGCGGDASDAWQRHGHGHVGPESVPAAVRAAFAAAEAPPPAGPGAEELAAVEAYRHERWA